MPCKESPDLTADPEVLLAAVLGPKLSRSLSLLGKLEAPRGGSEGSRRSSWGLQMVSLGAAGPAPGASSWTR